MANLDFWWPCWILPKKMMFARIDFSTFLIYYSGDLSGNKSEEKSSVAICGGLSHNLA